MAVRSFESGSRLRIATGGNRRGEPYARVKKTFYAHFARRY
jgi:hypothetical protein